MTLTVSDMLVVLQLVLHNLHESSFTISWILNQFGVRGKTSTEEPVHRFHQLNRRLQGPGVAMKGN